MSKKISDYNSLTKSQKINTKANYIIISTFCLTLAIFTTLLLINGDPHNRLVACISTFFCYLVPIFFQLIFKNRLSPLLVSIYLAFITLAAFCGSCLNLNSLIPFMDKIQHFTWGYIACFIGIYYLCKSKEYDSLKPLTIIVVFFAISLATAGIWEVIEFAGDNLLGQTAQGPKINGITSVSDAMFDIITHFCGSVLFIIHYCIDRFAHKKLGFTHIINDFKSDF